jgi:hypothetical protein
MPSKRATTDALKATPSDSRLVLPGIDVTQVAGMRIRGGGRPVRLRLAPLDASAELVEPPGDPLRHVDDLCIAFTSRLGAHDIARSEHDQG